MRREKGIIDGNEDESSNRHMDVNIVITSARSHNLPLLVATATSQYFNTAVSQGMMNDESTRLMDVIRKMTGDPLTQ